MAMHAGVGLSKAAILIGAGFTGSILVRNGKLSDLLADLQNLLKSTEESGADSAESVVAQVNRLAMEIRQLASARSITVVNGGSGEGNVTTLLVPAATLGALGYGYMWWKGLSFSDLMYVTKRNMANAVSGMTKHLEQVSSALALALVLNGFESQRGIGSDISHVLTSPGQLTAVCVNSSSQSTSHRLLAYEATTPKSTIRTGVAPPQPVSPCLALTSVCSACKCATSRATGVRHCGVQHPVTNSLLTRDGPKRSNLRGYLGPAEESRDLKGLKHILEALNSESLDSANLEGLLPNNSDSLETVKDLSRQKNTEKQKMTPLSRSILLFFLFIFASILFISLSTNARLLYEAPTAGLVVDHYSERNILLESPAENWHRGPVPAGSLGN
ncbi:hypothetical protein MA16_Dca023960 [Dendrobium catenatum]|uniref:DUF1664 domain-containing protein n=1 Tax=Dendrobium catenatum TaxID=906689 RepID=A0A2I0VJG9_9ASPA|nr:hypothetical protein MA16_Dca023960 [Dendrobium catenatum]